MTDFFEKLAYLAGYFDGEGSIIFRKKSRRDVMNHVAVVNTDSVTLHEFEHMFGGRVIEINRRVQGKNLKTIPENGYKKCYQWQASGRYARQFLLMIYPYLRHRDRIEKAKRALTFDEERGMLTIGNRTNISRGPRSKQTATIQ